MFILLCFQNELKAQRDKLQREREALQRQMDLFEQQKREYEHAKQQQERERSESPSPAAAAIIRSHRRTGSNDLQLTRGDSESHFEPLPTAQSSSLKEALNKTRARQTPTTNTPTPNTQNQLPMFLSNADKPSVLQKLPFKLADKTSKSSSGSAGGVVAASKSKLAPSGVSQSSVAAPGTQQAKIAEQNKLTQTRSHPTLPGVRPQNPVSNMLPWKLAEGKSNSRPNSANTKKGTSRSEQEKFV